MSPIQAFNSTTLNFEARTETFFFFKIKFICVVKQSSKIVFVSEYQALHLIVTFYSFKMH